MENEPNITQITTHISYTTSTQLMSRPHQTFRQVPIVKLLGIMFRNRCWPITFQTITAGDADGWCLDSPV